MSDESESVVGGIDRLTAFVPPSLNVYQLGVLVVAILGAITVPFWAGGATYVLATASLWAVFAMGWDIISGHTGYISFGHSLLSGSAAYTTALLVYNVDPHLPILVTFPLSVLVAVIVGLIFALPSLRLKGPYFSLVTFVSVLIALKLVNIFSTYTNGELGIQSIPTLTYDNTLLYYETLALAFVVAGVLLYVSRSNVGRILLAIRESEETVEAAGLDTTKFKLWAFTLSSITMGIGGAMLAHFYGTVSPSNALVNSNSIEMIAMAAVGGMGTILGPMCGAYLLVFLRDSVFQNVFDLGPSARFVALWAVVLVLFVVTPDGIFVRGWRYLGSLGGEDDE